MTLDELRIALDPERRRAAFEAWKAAQVERCLYFEQQDCDGPIEDVVPQTAYGDEPDRFRMCKRHADDYREHWAQMWDEYRRGCL